ncbi:hypothetical protein AABB24_036360, partial [Solanum stoloniferum]
SLLFVPSPLSPSLPLLSISSPMMSPPWTDPALWFLLLWIINVMLMCFLVANKSSNKSKYLVICSSSFLPSNFIVLYQLCSLFFVCRILSKGGKPLHLVVM